MSRRGSIRTRRFARTGGRISVPHGHRPWRQRRIRTAFRRAPTADIRLGETVMRTSGITQADWTERAKRRSAGRRFRQFRSIASVHQGRSRQPRLTDEDGKEYIDYLIGSGPDADRSRPPRGDRGGRFEQLSKGMTFFANNTVGHGTRRGNLPRCTPAPNSCDMSPPAAKPTCTPCASPGRSLAATRCVKFEGGYHGMSAEALMSLAPKRASPTSRKPCRTPPVSRLACATDMLIAPFNDRGITSRWL